MPAPSILFEIPERLAGAAVPLHTSDAVLLLGVGGLEYNAPFVGDGRVAGTVYLLSTSTPAPGRLVRLYDRASGLLLRQVLSELDGTYAFEDVATNREVYVVAVDAIPGYDPVVSPVVEPFDPSP